jgi:hypothetical protein
VVFDFLRRYAFDRPVTDLLFYSLDGGMVPLLCRVFQCRQVFSFPLAEYLFYELSALSGRT